MAVSNVTPYVLARKVNGKVVFYFLCRKVNGKTVPYALWAKKNRVIKTFNASEDLQTFVVPETVTSIKVDCVGSRGFTEGDKSGGKGGRVQCNIAVTAGQTLYFMVGGIPSQKTTATYNASDIRRGGTAYSNRILVAGGGGNGCSAGTGSGNVGGAGGGTTAGSGGGVGYQTQATGGSQTAGGTASARSGGNIDGWYGGSDGTLGLGGNGGSAGGGAGGAGYYGGGGGSVYDINKVGVTCAPGGGGSSYANSSYCTNVVHTQGYNSGIGYITIEFLQEI